MSADNPFVDRDDGRRVTVADIAPASGAQRASPARPGTRFWPRCKDNDGKTYMLLSHRSRIIVECIVAGEPLARR